MNYTCWICVHAFSAMPKRDPRKADPSVEASDRLRVYVWATRTSFMSNPPRIYEFESKFTDNLGYSFPKGSVSTKLFSPVGLVLWKVRLFKQKSYRKYLAKAAGNHFPSIWFIHFVFNYAWITKLARIKFLHLSMIIDIPFEQIFSQTKEYVVVIFCC